MKTSRQSLLFRAPSWAFVPIVLVAMTATACGDDATGAGGSGGTGDDGTTTSAATQPGTASIVSTASGAGGDDATSGSDVGSGGSAGSGGAGGDTTSQSSAGGDASGGGPGGHGEGGHGEGGHGEGGDGVGGDGDGGAGGAGDGGSDGEGGSGGASSACVEISGSDFALLGSGDGAFYYQGQSTVGFDGPDPDMIRLDLLSDSLTGVVDLGFSAGQSPQICEACMFVLADYVDQVTQRIFFVDSGQVDFGTSTPPNIQGSFVDVTLVEVEIDLDIYDFVPVPGGMCLHIDEMAFDVEI